MEENHSLKRSLEAQSRKKLEEENEPDLESAKKA